MRILKPSIAAAVALLLWLEPAHAQVLTSIASFGPQAGISKARGEDANVIFGAALRYKLFPALGLEGSVNYRQEEFAGEALIVRSWPIQVTGMLYPLPFVYGAMGAGWYMTTFDYKGLRPLFEDDTSSEFGWHFGGGIELPLGNTAKLAGDLRYVFLDYHFDALPGSSEIDDDFYMATAGLLFNL